MDNAPHILLTDNTSDGPSNIVFLLRLSGFDVREFGDELEACNWMLQKDPTQSPNHLLILHEPKADRSLFALLFQMRQKYSRLELLLVSAEPLVLTGQILDLDPPVHQCPPDAVHSRVRKIIKDTDSRQVRQDSSPETDAGQELSKSAYFDVEEK